jgi:formylglycine-generating enzyme required for sulfatase activity
MRPIARPASLLRMARIAATLAVGACGTAAGTPPTDEPPPRRVVLDNRSGEPLRLYRAQRDGWGPAVAVGGGATIALELVPGRYAVAIGDDVPTVPLPIPLAELGFRPPGDPTALTVWPQPAPEAGWCWIPPGIGLRGDDLGIGQEDERPVSTPTLSGFWLAARETSNAQFVAFLNAIAATAVDTAWLDLEGRKCRIHQDEAARAFTTDAPELPVVTVAWHGAVAYCDWLTRTTGVRHRLPGETEWEKAARGPGSRVFAYGDTYRTAAANQESGTLLAVGSFPPNGFGLFDMTGNAFEWTDDVFVRGAYSTPRPPLDNRDLTDHRALRGGSFVLDGIFVRNSMRMRLRPTVRADDVGFRVLRENTDPSFGPIP